MKKQKQDEKKDRFEGLSDGVVITMLKEENEILSDLLQEAIDRLGKIDNEVSTLRQVLLLEVEGVEDLPF